MEVINICFAQNFVLLLSEYLFCVCLEYEKSIHRELFSIPRNSNKKYAQILLYHILPLRLQKSGKIENNFYRK